MSVVASGHFHEEPLLAALELAAAVQGDLVDAQPEPVERPRVLDAPTPPLVAIATGVAGADHRVVDDDGAGLRVATEPRLGFGQSETTAGALRGQLDERQL